MLSWWMMVGEVPPKAGTPPRFTVLARFGQEGIVSYKVLVKCMLRGYQLYVILVNDGEGGASQSWNPPRFTVIAGSG